MTKWGHYTDSLNIEYGRRLKIESCFDRAIAENEITLVYQPRYHINTNEIAGMEALARWESEELGSIPPDEFIPIAEDAGYIDRIGEHLLKMALAQFEAWQPLVKDKVFGFAVNLSPYQVMSSSFVVNLKSYLDPKGIDLTQIEFELTEAVFKGDDAQIELALNSIRDLKIRLAIDDFGIGYSSLSRLKSLPINILKIDQSFVRDISTDENDAAIVKSIIALANALQLEVVAEGVETKEQLDFLKENGCQYVQGYYFSKPITADKMDKILLK